MEPRLSISLHDEQRSLHVLPTPLVEVDVEIVESDVGGGDEDVLDGGIDPLEHSEVEHLGAPLVEVRRQLPAVVRHGPRSPL